MRRFLALGLFLTLGCSNEEPEWRVATTENSISALENFLIAYPEGEFVDSANDQLQSLRLADAISLNTIDGFLAFLDQSSDRARSVTAREALRALYRTRALAARPLTQVSYLQRSGTPRVLQTADGTDIARYFRESGSWLTVDAATGDTLYATHANASGEPVAPRWLCLDESGSILRTNGEPILVPPFRFESFVEAGGVTSRVEYDPYGRPEVQYVPQRGCTNCAEETGVKDCVFVW